MHRNSGNLEMQEVFKSTILYGIRNEGITHISEVREDEMAPRVLSNDVREGCLSELLQSYLEEEVRKEEAAIYLYSL